MSAFDSLRIAGNCVYALRAAVSNANEVGEQFRPHNPTIARECLDSGLLNGAALCMDDGQSTGVHSVQQPVSEADAFAMLTNGRTGPD
jgi:hypothetical protein